jgi:hypothetical protein
MFISAWELIILKFIIYMEQKGIQIPIIKYYFNMYSIFFKFFIYNYALENDGMPGIQCLKETGNWTEPCRNHKITIYKSTCV